MSQKEKGTKGFSSGSHWAYDNDFKIDTINPSEVVNMALVKNLIPAKSRVLDLGAGKNPRNAIHLASTQKCFVDIFDLEPPDIPNNLPAEVVFRIKSEVGSVLDYDYGLKKYKTAVMARLIQYIPQESLQELPSNVNRSLKNKGVLLLSYTASGGIHKKSEEYSIDTFQYPIEKVNEFLDNANFNVIFLQKGATKSMHVPHSGEPAVTYDLIALKK